MTIHTIDGRPALRFERRLPHPPERVWRAVTDPAELGQWYPLRVTELDPRPGGRLVFDDGADGVITGEITDFEPPRLFAFDEHDPEGRGRAFNDHARIELHPDAQGCLLVFTHVFADATNAESYSRGWEECLDALVTALDAG
ncbi:SRPBCC family protein [Marinactinospora rubrisoli]|uniref:SRPBCC family protein n=1 Tax=Marinactinospora rubrisoli TaxID=2715399 RepID=A0ABW2KHY6_9ACTN